MLFELDQVFARTEDWFELRCKQQLEEQTIGPNNGSDSVLEVRSARPCPSKNHSINREQHPLNISSALKLYYQNRTKNSNKIRFFGLMSPVKH